MSCVGGYPRALARLEGKNYSELPAGLCQGYADILFGKTQEHEYGGVICDRNGISYLLLQRLADYTSDRKAIWTVVGIFPLTHLQPQESTVSAGCQHQEDQAAAVVAVVKARASQLRVQKAWQIDLQQEQLTPLSPQLVRCSLPVLKQQL